MAVAVCCRPVPCSETYQYYTLPFCQHKDGKKYVTEDLGEVLEGDRLVNTPYDIRFRQDVDSQVLCTKKLTGNDLFNIRMAIAEDYYFQVCSSSMAGHRVEWRSIGVCGGQAGRSGMRKHSLCGQQQRTPPCGDEAVCAGAGCCWQLQHESCARLSPSKHGRWVRQQQLLTAPPRHMAASVVAAAAALVTSALPCCAMLCCSCCADVL